MCAKRKVSGSTARRMRKCDAHYVTGYLYNPVTDRLQTFDGRVIRNALPNTCKRVAQEMNGLALRSNTITFRAHLSSPREIDIPSEAAVFEDLVRQRRVALTHMVGFSHTLVTSDILQALCDRWPGFKAVERFGRHIDENGTLSLDGGDPELYRYQWGVDWAMENSVKDDLVQLLTKHPRFDELTCSGYMDPLRCRFQRRTGYTDEEMNETWEGDEFEREVEDRFLDDRTGLPYYTEATRHRIIDWQPRNWWIPTEKDIAAVQEFIFSSPIHDYDEHTGNVVEKLYFSATAVAIRFLKRVATHTREQLRILVLEEDHPSIASPHTHVQGLVPFMRENRRLQVQHRVNVWQAILVPNSFKKGIATSLRQITYWIQQAKAIQQHNIEPTSYSLLLHGPSPTKSQNLSDTVLHAARWQDANVDFFQETGEEFEDYKQTIMEGFPELIKEMIQGHIPARFDADYEREPWDPAAVLRQYQGDWPRERKDAIADNAFVEPDGGWEAARREYWIDLDVYDRLAWWNQLVEDL
jgi:hypothetical protein